MRSSWESVARNSSFARLAASASVRAFSAAMNSRSRSASARLRSVMSRRKALKVWYSPSCTATRASSTGTSDPSRRTAIISTRRLSRRPSPVRR